MSINTIWNNDKDEIQRTKDWIIISEAKKLKAC